VGVYNLYIRASKQRKATGDYEMVSLLTTQVKTFFSREKANETAAMLNADEYDDWTYVAKHDPKGTGYSFIEIYDEDGEFVSDF